MDTLIDPTTRDYVRGADGRYALADGDGLANAVYIRIMTPLGKYWAAPDVGSRLYELERAKGTSNKPALAVQYAQQALQPLVDGGRAKSVAASAQMDSHPDGAKWLKLSVTVTSPGGQKSVFQFPVKVN